MQQNPYYAQTTSKRPENGVLLTLDSEAANEELSDRSHCGKHVHNRNSKDALKLRGSEKKSHFIFSLLVYVDLSYWLLSVCVRSLFLVILLNVQISRVLRVSIALSTSCSI